MLVKRVGQSLSNRSPLNRTVDAQSETTVRCQHSVDLLQRLCSIGEEL
jgi:hypothetical protein